MLIIINEMALTKPQAEHSNLYTKRARTDGELVRDAALRELSDSEPDDYRHGNNSRKLPSDNEDTEYVDDVDGYFNDKPMSLEEEARMDQELLREMCEAQGGVNTDEVHVDDVDSDQDSNCNYQQNVRENETPVLPSTSDNQSWTDMPTSSRDCRYSIPLGDLAPQVCTNSLFKFLNFLDLKKI